MGRANNNANANGGLAYSNANNASSNSNTNNSARLTMSFGVSAPQSFSADPYAIRDSHRARDTSLGNSCHSPATEPQGTDERPATKPQGTDERPATKPQGTDGRKAGTSSERLKVYKQHGRDI